MVGCPPYRSDMSDSFPVVDKRRFRICRSRLRSGTTTTTTSAHKEHSTERERERARETDLGVGVTQLDRDIPHELVLESDGHDSRYRLYYGRFSVCDMTDRACAQKGLSRQLRRQRRVTRTEIYGSLRRFLRKGREQRERSALTCFEMTSGESGVSFETSMSIFGMMVSTSSSSSESDSS